MSDEPRPGTVGSLLPHDNPVARFMLVMWAVHNDVLHSGMAADDAGQRNAFELNYYIRLNMSHLYEAGVSIRAYRDTFPEVKAFLNRLPNDAQKAMKRVAHLDQQVRDRRAGGDALRHARVSTFHYPSPSSQYEPDLDARLASVMQAFANEPVRMTMTEHPEGVTDRMETADQVMVTLALIEHTIWDDDRLRRQLTKSAKAGGEFRQFVRAAWSVYLSERGYQERFIPDLPHDAA